MHAPMTAGAIRVGTAGWSLPGAHAHRFGPGASHLQRYATRLPAAEINSSFHRPHQAPTYERWAAAVPPGFRFSVKLPKAISHERRLQDCDAALHEFLGQARGLGDRLGCLLVQLPPSLAFDAQVAGRFLNALRRAYEGHVALEPRHESWFAEGPDALLRQLRVARVLADPVRHAPGRWPGGWTGLTYLRLHGSPRVYYSAYSPDLLRALASRMALAARSGDVWCIFDNTAGQAAADNALELISTLEQEPA